MAALVVDTSSFISHLARCGWPGLAAAVDEQRVWLPPIVAAELLSKKLSSRNRSHLEAFLLDLRLCRADHAHWFRVGALRAHLRSRGLTVTIPDVHVAQCALDLDAELLTEDGDFRGIAKHSDLRLVSDW